MEEDIVQTVRYLSIIFYKRRITIASKLHHTKPPQLVTSLTHSHPPFKFSFHSVTFPSPQLTAKMFPARLHETRHTTSGNLPAPVAGAPAGEIVLGSSAVLTHGAVAESFVQMRTVLSCTTPVNLHPHEPIYPQAQQE